MKKYHFYIDCLVNSGPSNALLALVDGLLSNGNQVEIHVLERFDPLLSIPSEVVIHMYEPKRYKYFNKVMSIAKTIILLLSIRKRKFHKTDDIHVVYSFLSLGMMHYVYSQSKDYYFVLHANPINLKKIHTSRFARFWLITNFYFMKYANSIICVSESVRLSLQSSLSIPKQTTVMTIFNMCNIEDLANKLEQAKSIELNLSKVQKRIAFVGRIIPEKGIDLLLNIIKALKDHYEIELLIIGEGSKAYMESICDEINTLDISNQIRFLGFQRNPLPFLLQSDLFVLPTESEGLPIAILEALYANCPVVASNVEGCVDILKYHGNTYGGLCDRTVESFVQEIRKNLDGEAIYDEFDYYGYNQQQLLLWYNL